MSISELIAYEKGKYATSVNDYYIGSNEWLAFEFGRLDAKQKWKQRKRKRQPKNERTDHE